ncbi:hypothetical protein EXIGLDRAFT_775951 [Exidia glandulosa HHB12029]|uniref:Hydrophobic surface binding protein n=1 Tax=Exidia glandulosa HHB12029 TaxID=1314781 RepID=A0A165DP16_EXIGL|nr:hypothetical protein EXIGLDRAFT_775951 [Exidia glandulosa HHB12029]
MFVFKQLVLLAAALPAVLGTVAQIQADITAIGARLATLENALTAFTSSGDILGALGVHTDATNVDSAIKTAATDTTNTAAFSETDGAAILKAVQGIEPNIIATLNAVVAKKATFQGVPIGGVPTLVKQDLAALSTDTKAFENALLAKAPADLKSQANTIIAALDAAFATATAAYAQF